MTTLVHIAASSQEDPRCRLLASAIRQYMQADTQAEADQAQTETETHTELGTGTHTEPGTGTEEAEELAEQAEIHTQTNAEPPPPRTPGTTELDPEEQEIHPPPPQASSHSFTSHITPTLAMLAAKLPLQRMYRPLRQSRPVGVWERGYWLCIYPDIHGPILGHIHGDSGSGTDTGIGNRLGQDKVRDMWQFLTEIIHQGKAGWGVWGVKNQSKGACQIKVYCWGEIVPYIYLLFLVGSDRRLNMSLQWRDAADNVVVQM